MNIDRLSVSVCKYCGVWAIGQTRDSTKQLMSRGNSVLSRASCNKLFINNQAKSPIVRTVASKYRYSSTYVDAFQSFGSERRKGMLPLKLIVAVAPSVEVV